MQASAAGPQFARRLGTPQQKQAHHGEFRAVQLHIGKRRVAETLAEFLHPALEILVAGDQVLGFEITSRSLNDARLEREHGIATGFLVARIGQRVHRQGVLIRRDDRFFHQATEHARFVHGEFDVQLAISRLRGEASELGYHR
jgi:hypothetical protein